MKMNIFRYLALSFLASLVFAGCNELDQQPTNKFTDKSFWVSTDKAKLVLNMAYNQMYKHDKIWLDESLSDNFIKFRGSPDEKVIRMGNANPSTDLFRSEWKWVFEGIKTTNVFMDNVDLIPEFDSQEKERMKAEVRFIRAFLYFRLSNLYGDIPFFLGDITLEESKNMTRTPRAQVISTLHSELDEIIPLLPKREDLKAGEQGRITKAAAVMLKARMYLYDGQMDKVKTECDKLINQQGTYGAYSLFTTSTGTGEQYYSAYENLFTSAYEYNQEVILDYAAVPQVKEWQMIDYVPQSVTGSRVTNGSPTQSLVDAYLKDDGTIWNEGDAAYTGRDPRMSATVVYHNFKWKDERINSDNSRTPIVQTIDITGNNSADKWSTSSNATQSGYYTRKYFDPAHREDLKMHNNIIIMRYADVLLMYAEACEADGTFNQAVWDMTIRPIRERAGFTNPGALDYPGASGETMKEVIARERRCELAVEGLRYYDIMRMDATQRSVALNKQALGAKFAINNSQYILIATYKYNSRDRWWSLPQSELDLVPSLVNNSGY